MEVEATVFNRVRHRGQSFDSEDDVGEDVHKDSHERPHDKHCRRKQRHIVESEEDEDDEEQSGASAASSDNSNERYEQEARPAQKLSRSEAYKAKFRELQT